MPKARTTVLQDIDWLAPSFALYVEDTLVAGGLSPERRELTQDVSSLEFDHSLLLTNEMVLQIANADNRYTDSTIFAPGNEVELHLGYGNSPAFIGRGRISRFLPTFPADGIPSLTIKCLDPSHRMMREEYEIKGSKHVNTKKPKGIFEIGTSSSHTDIFAIGEGGAGRPKKQTSGRVWKGPIGQILKQLLQPYDIRLDIDSALSKIAESFPQRKGTSDYEVCRALAALYDAEFFVEWEPASGHRGTSSAVKRVTGTGQWIARFRQSREFAGQDSKIIFRYGGLSPTLISADLQYAVDESVNEVEVQLYDRKARGWKAVSVEEKPGGAKRIRFAPGVTAKGGPLGPVQAGVDLPEIKNMSLVRISVEGHGVTVPTPRKFRSAEAASLWAKRWVQDHKDSFLMVQGETIGVSDLRSGQTHQLEGLGKQYSGDYYFTQVKHVYKPDSGYRCQFTANKVLEK